MSCTAQLSSPFPNACISARHLRGSGIVMRKDGHIKMKKDRLPRKLKKKLRKQGFTGYVEEYLSLKYNRRV